MVMITVWSGWFVSCVLKGSGAEPGRGGDGSISTTSSTTPAPVPVCPPAPLVQQTAERQNWPKVYISYSRYSPTINDQALDLARQLTSQKVIPILDQCNLNKLADNEIRWMEDKIGKARYVLVLVDSKHPMHQKDIIDDDTPYVDNDGSYRRSVNETRILMGEQYARRSNFMIPVFIGSGAESYQDVTPPILRCKTLIHLPMDFTAKCDQFQALIALLYRPVELPTGNCLDE